MDCQEHIVDRVRAALSEGAALRIHGGRSKDFYGYPARGEALDISGHSGIVEYDPGELIMTCRAGSQLAKIRTALADNGQHLPFEPPAFGEAATIGGTVACGFSGPRRPWSGSLRDYLLGVRLVNGRGEAVRFGGQVMKNVAGYDISRLVAGSMGTLGVILDVSFKVLPLPAGELTLSFSCDEAEAIGLMNRWAGKPLPLSAATWHRGRLRLRLSGTADNLARAVEQLEPGKITEDCSYWERLREQELDFFQAQAPLWRLSLPAASPPLDIQGDCLLDWGGSQRWYLSDQPGETIRKEAAARGGHATLFRGESDDARFHPLPAAMQQLQARIKQAMDPAGLFNPQRMSRDW
jgi:glycolate oxidase FAD binding subunit